MNIRQSAILVSARLLGLALRACDITFLSYLRRLLTADARGWRAMIGRFSGLDWGADACT